MAIAIELFRTKVALKPEMTDHGALQVAIKRSPLSFPSETRDTPSFTGLRPNRSKAAAPNEVALMIVDSIRSKPLNVIRLNPHEQFNDCTKGRVFARLYWLCAHPANGTNCNIVR